MTAPRLGTASPRLDALEYSTRVMLRTVGPRVYGAVNEIDDVSIRRCARCESEPTIYECPVCNWQTTARYQLRLHLKLNPRWCQELGEQRARRWASNV